MSHIYLLHLLLFSHKMDVKLNLSPGTLFFLKLLSTFLLYQLNEQTLKI